MAVGAIVFILGLARWINQLLPGRGELHEPRVEPARRPQPVAACPVDVERVAAGHARLSLRLPARVHPISAGIKGGLVGGLVMPLPALVYGSSAGTAFGGR